METHEPNFHVKPFSLPQALKRLRLAWMTMASYFWATRPMRWMTRASSSGAKTTLSPLTPSEPEQKPRRTGRLFKCSVDWTFFDFFFFLWSSQCQEIYVGVRERQRHIPVERKMFSICQVSDLVEPLRLLSLSVSLSACRSLGASLLFTL